MTPLPPPKAADTFRIVAWNVAGGFAKKFERLESLQPDVAVVPEACDEARLLRKGIDRYSSMAWFGRSPNRGLGVLGFGATKVKLMGKIWDFRIQDILPVAVTGPLPFTLFGTVAYYDKSVIDHRTENWDIAPGMILDTYPQLLECDWVLAGDCNHHPVFDKGKPRWDFGSLIEAYAERGMVSAWHAHHEVGIGAEGEPPTFWLTYKEHKPYMLDWCFIPAAWQDRLVGAWIGDYEHWCASPIKSDHAPLVIDLRI